ncbi:MAG: hypothetical protein ACLGI8_08005 [Acidimicrobiia bacterium]
MLRTITSRRARLGAGLVAMTVAAATGLAGLQASANTVEEPATVARQAYFTYPVTDVTPPVLTNGFPPGTVCLVAGLVGAAQLCGEEVQEVGGGLGLSDGIPIPVSPDGEIAQPVAPGTTPVGMLGGQPRYVSLLQLALPTLPEGQGFDSFELVVRQDGLNYAAESPAVRAVVLAALSQVSSQDPARLAEEVGQALTSGELTTETVTGIEACPATETWTGGDAQGAAADGTRVPDSDCVLGTTGVYDPEAGTWTFDLTFAAQAWTEGAPGRDGPLPNEGIVLRPVGAPNLAYGDPDFSTNWTVSFGDGEAGEATRPVIRYTTSPLATETGLAPVDVAPVDVAPSAPFEVPAFDAGSPSLAPTAPQPSPGAALAGTLRARWAERASSRGSGELPAWMLLALPLGLAGAALFGQAAVAPAAASRRRPGALTRLMTSGSAGPDDLLPDPSRS